MTGLTLVPEPLVAAVDGSHRPVNVALWYILECMPLTAVDVESFVETDKLVGEIEGEPGFPVKTMQDVARLCKIGRFEIVIEGGMIHARR